MYNTVNESDVTIYVLPGFDKMLIFKTKLLKQAAKIYGHYVETPTSQGLALPIDKAKTVGEAKEVDVGHVEADIPTTSLRARESERVFCKWANERGYTCTLHPDKETQVRGIDATIVTSSSSITIQLKYDGRAADTNRIYYELAELNPSKSY